MRESRRRRDDGGSVRTGVRPTAIGTNEGRDGGSSAGEAGASLGRAQARRDTVTVARSNTPGRDFGK